ncbi:MAG: C25 family cysteine peptidase, partial [Candidatus Riflebacteria bacterium]|nr:C25 family cysteine peptidase [Candidatus Riflebacteria bacterium]
MKSKFFCRSSFLLLVAFLLLTCANTDAQIRVNTDRSLGADIHVATPKLEKISFTADGQEFTGLYMRHANLLVEKKKPALPVLTGMVMISPNQKPILEVIKSKFTEISLDKPVVPSRGAILRNVDPATVPFVKGPIYKKDAWFPADSEVITISKPFIFRETRGVRLEVMPVQYNPVTGKLRIYTSIHAKISYDGPGKINIQRGRSELSRAFAPLYRKAFLNFASVPRRLSPVDENGRLIIIAADELKAAAAPLAEWKQKCGINTILVTTSELGGAKAENIKAFLQQQYDEIGFSHVILVGDAEQIPTNKGENEKADSDPVYVKLAGDDHVPDAIISRISAAKPEQVSYQIAKIINYEQYPAESDDAAWYTRALGIGSSEGNPPDFEYIEELRQALLTSKFSEVDTAYDAKAASGNTGSGGGYDGYPYPGSYPGFPGMNPHFPMQPMPYAVSADRNTSSRGTLKEKVFESVNKGVSLINYMGHGSTSSWATSGFSNTDCSKLTNGLKLPVIVSVACVNGNFVGKDCFCEAWMNSGDIENPR